jgi:hypothetical protein
VVGAELCGKVMGGWYCVEFECMDACMRVSYMSIRLGKDSNYSKVTSVRMV